MPKRRKEWDCLFSRPFPPFYGISSLYKKDIIIFVDRSLACAGTQVKMDLFFAC